MQPGFVARRTQFSSCDECRRLRVRCDNPKQGAGNGPGDISDSCARCLKRHRKCTFEWMNDVNRQAPKRRHRPRHQSVSSTASNITSPSREPESPNTPGLVNGALWHTACETATNVRASVATTDRAEFIGSPLDTLRPFDFYLLQAIYSTGFDAIFGSWMGRYGCPFLSESTTGEDHNSITDVCNRLDRWMMEMPHQDLPVPLNGVIREHSLEDRLADESLRSTIASFSARWLPLASQTPDAAPCYQGVVHALWRHARRDMLRVINRPSYRSMLALFLFALTPVPTGISEEEEADGISGQVCIHAALQQIQTLRARQRSLQFNGTKVSQPTKSHTIPAIPETVGASDFITAENIAYWAALTFDTSASLTLDCRSLLSSGLFGFEAELPWRLVRTGATMFQTKMENWHAHSVYDMTDEHADEIIATGTAWKLLAWKLTAVFKEALRDGHDESEVLRAFSLVTEAIQQFHETYRPSLEACQRRMPFLSQQTKFRWYSLMLHYYLSILLLANVIEASDRLDLLADLEEANADAESVVVNTLMFGLHNTITLSVKMESDPFGSVGAAETSVTVLLVSIDPYPHHIVAGVQLVQKAIDRDRALGKISHGAHASLQSVLEKTLSHLPQCSKSVKAVRDMFSSKVLSHGAGQPSIPYPL